MSFITAIELENFQSIARRTRFDLKPITLLFGPNSAGKSALFDAIELLRFTLDPLLFDEDRVIDMVDRWARRQGNANTRETFVAVEFNVDLDVVPQDVWWTERGSHSSKSYFPSIYWDDDILKDYNLDNKVVARIELCFRIQNHKNHDDCFISESKCLINGKVIAAVQKQIPGRSDSQSSENNDEQDDAERYLLIPARSENIFQAGCDTDRDVKKLNDSELGEDVHTLQIISTTSPFDVTPSFAGAAEDAAGVLLCQNLTDIFFYLGKTLWDPFRSKPGVVRADRRTPSPQEALVVVDLNLGGWWNRGRQSPSSPAELLKATNANTDEHVRGMATLTHAAAVYRASKADFWGGSHAEKNLSALKSLSDHLARINKHLETSLFTEKLYQLTCESTLMVPLDLQEDDPNGYYLLAQPAATRLTLRDQDGMKLELQDVGSGIPYVLPVLYSATSGGFSMVQQPELHLHPALQSSIADIFIEELNENVGSQFLIETHSEHLLLRILRRIRESEKQKCLSQLLELDNTQVAVYYFNPHVGGETHVSSLPISPIGDFYTDWPRGFFEERNNDLFDED